MRELLRRLPFVDRKNKGKDIPLSASQTPGRVVFNPYADEDLFRREAFLRVPGALRPMSEREWRIRNSLPLNTEHGVQGEDSPK